MLSNGSIEICRKCKIRIDLFSKSYTPFLVMNTLPLTGEHERLAFELKSYKKIQNLSKSQWQERPWIAKCRLILERLKNEESSVGTQWTELWSGSPVSLGLPLPGTVVFLGNFWIILFHAQRRCGPDWLLSYLREKSGHIQHLANTLHSSGVTCPLCFSHYKEREPWERKLKMCPSVNKLIFFTFKKKIQEAYLVHLFKVFWYFEKEKWSNSGLNLAWIIWNKVTVVWD